MTTQEFKVGQKVFDILFGWGVIIKASKSVEWGIVAGFGKRTVCYTSKGKYSHESITPTLSHTEYRLTTEPAFPRMMEVGMYLHERYQRKVLFIRDGKSVTYLEDLGYVEYDYYREIQPKKKLTIAEIAEKFGIEADKIEIVE
jgi:hypothetical protein